MTIRSGILLSIPCAVLVAACSGAPVKPSQVDSPQAPPPQGQPQQVSAAGFGLTREEAIEVCQPKGERDYLARLVCPDHSHPQFKRFGNVGGRNDFPPGMSEQEQERILDDLLASKPLQAGETDYHIVDGYTLQCGDASTRVFLDMYHCDAPPPRQAPTGFTIIN